MVKTRSNAFIGVWLYRLVGFNALILIKALGYFQLYSYHKLY
ncbi:hypothetical protein [Helicobacter pylori]|nr:hypothetical protein [Helicobacter pylori]